MMKTIFLATTLLVTFFTCCEDSNSDVKSIGFETELAQRTDQNIHDQIRNDSFAGNQSFNDSFFLKGAEIVDSQLHINVSYSGGCQEHAFELLWPEVIDAIYPPQFDLILAHDGNDDACEALISEILIFDLSGNSLGIGEDVFKIMKLGVVNSSNPDEIIQVNE